MSEERVHSTPCYASSFYAVFSLLLGSTLLYSESLVGLVRSGVLPRFRAACCASLRLVARTKAAIPRNAGLFRQQIPEEESRELHGRGIINWPRLVPRNLV